MGIESDQLVLDYLSRVGDLAQQRQLSSGERMRLVSELRTRIEQQRAHGADNPAAVKKILGRLGTPDDVVGAAGGRSQETRGTKPGRPARPEHRPVTEPGEAADSPAPGNGSNGSTGTTGGNGGERATSRGGALRKLSGFARRTGLAGDNKVPSPRGGGKKAAAEPPVVPVIPLDGPAPPHLAGEDELGPRGADTDWWRVEPGPFGPGGAGGPGGTGFFGPGESVPGFVGGIEIPDILKPPPQDPFRKDPEPEAVEAEPDGDEAEPAGTGRSRGTTSPLLLLAAALLVGGAVFGSLVALGLGWLIAYAGPRLSRVEAKWATLAVPGLVAAGAVVWLWGRHEGRWGEPIARGAMAEALTETWPVALRTAAVASALFLLWRARRR
ncbi:hypothetical protein [Streptomyces sp. Ru87]|uniref:hypothetical protein n=1 Tax=Streptomyces sp. Ru87 TaxID=2044307 RepID=UPI000BF2DC9A|nr:hypothetical protein [Streptomyces sp. Ru87]PGH49009.1 hypothetical protein CRI70_19990 [Streptomyces sp. Ru87]